MRNIFTFLLLNLLNLNLAGQNSLFNCTDSAIVQSFEAKLTSTVFNPGPSFNEKLMNTSWYLSTIVLYNNEIVKDKNLKYNNFDDSFIWLEPTNLRRTRLEKEHIKEVFMVSPDYRDTIRFKKTMLKLLGVTDSTEVFLNVLVEGKISLYVFRQIIFRTNNQNYENQFQYFLKKQNELFTRFSPNKVDLLAQFPAEKKKFRKIISKNGLSIKKEKDLIKAVKLFNEAL